MKKCSKCGFEIADGAKFCPECGQSVSNNETKTKEQHPTQKEEYAGSVKRCPSCGAPLPGLAALCPYCGYEINSTAVAPSYQDFVNEINECDRLIASSPNRSATGWTSWGIGGKIGWIILNVFTLCIPLLIYMALPLLGIGEKNATPEEMRKRAAIENFAFENNRETIIELLLFIKNKEASLEDERIDRRTLHWSAIWKNKADQVFQKAELLFKGDKIASEAYKAISASEAKIRKGFLVRVIAAGVLVLACVIFFVSL